MAVWLLTSRPTLPAATLHAEAIAGWDQYVRWADEKFEREISDQGRFLYRDCLPPDSRQRVIETLSLGSVAVRRIEGVIPPGRRLTLPDAAIHHWWGSILVRDVRLSNVLALAKDYDHHAGRFVEVQESRLISRSGETYRFYFRLRRTKAPITVYYNTEQECAYSMHGPALATSRSVALKIAEVDSPGTPRERERTSQDDSGFLWRAVTWWRFKETPEGVVVECESASLSRSIPGWLRFIPGAMRYLESVPRESIENTLHSLRAHSRR